MILSHLIAFVKSFGRNEEGVAAIEAAFVFPVLLILTLGLLDMGRGIMTNQKTIKASQVVADLVTRDVMIEDSEINEAMQAGTLSLQPYATDTLGFDVVSLRFLEDDVPEIVWRQTSPNITPLTYAELTTRTAALAEEDGGVIIVMARYLYEPIFSGFVVDEIPMEEVAFARGRKSAVVCKTGAPGC
jgi:Flp pilus assembly protein TadG